MRGVDKSAQAHYSVRPLEEWIPEDHPLRALKQLVDLILLNLSDELNPRYSSIGRPSIAPERLLRAALLQVIYTIRSERQLCEQLHYNLLYRWFVGLDMDEPAWDHSSFSRNRSRLLNQEVARLFFEQVKALAAWAELTSNEHFSVDGTLIDAWASHKSFIRKDGGSAPPGDQSRNPDRDFKGEPRSNATHQSKTDPEARLARKSNGDGSRLCHMAHTLMENRNGLIMDVHCTEVNGHAEVEAALLMLDRSVAAGSTVAADKGYDRRDFVQGCRDRGFMAHVAQKRKGSALDPHLPNQAGYAVSQTLRKRIEEGFGWLKTTAGLRKTKLIGRLKLGAQLLISFATYNLIRMARLLGFLKSASA